MNLVTQSFPTLQSSGPKDWDESTLPCPQVAVQLKFHLVVKSILRSVTFSLPRSKPSILLRFILYFPRSTSRPSFPPLFPGIVNFELTFRTLRTVGPDPEAQTKQLGSELELSRLSILEVQKVSEFGVDQCDRAFKTKNPSSIRVQPQGM